MKIYQTKVKKLSGTSFQEVRKKAFKIYQEISRKSKRKAYIRSAYFGKSKIFLDLFWSHLFEKKNFGDLMRRMRFYPCAIELIQKSRMEPVTKENPNKKSELLHRFYGITPDRENFCVQIKGIKTNGKKWLISVYNVHLVE